MASWYASHSLTARRRCVQTRLIPKKSPRSEASTYGFMANQARLNIDMSCLGHIRYKTSKSKAGAGRRVVACTIAGDRNVNLHAN